MEFFAGVAMADAGEIPVRALLSKINNYPIN
jgi:hypothetical protein